MKTAEEICNIVHQELKQLEGQPFDPVARDLLKRTLSEKLEKELLPIKIDDGYRVEERLDKATGMLHIDVIAITPECNEMFRRALGLELEPPRMIECIIKVGEP